MANIVQGMFGINPNQIGQDRYDTGFAQDLRAVQLDPMQQANLALRQGGRGIAQGAIAPMLGVQDPELQKAQMAQQLASQFDITSPAGLTQYAQALAQNGMPEFAQIAATKAQDMESKGLGIQQSQLGLQQSQLNIDKTKNSIDREEQLRAALAALPADASEEDYLKVYRQFGSPDQQARIIEAGINARAKLAGEAGGGGIGSIGKSGAYRDAYGTIYGGAEMKPVRAEYETSQRLLQTLNDVKASDIKDAESIIDWTTKEESRALAGKKTLAAQSKLAASQLLSQIEALPPGSASDKDMKAAMKDFPGYSDAEALRLWVNRTKLKLQRNIDAQSEQFGFKPRVTSSGDVSFKKQTTQQSPAGAPAKGTRTIKLSNGVEVTVQD
jgi:hypothetical protein